MWLHHWSVKSARLVAVTEKGVEEGDSAIVWLSKVVFNDHLFKNDLDRPTWLVLLSQNHPFFLVLQGQYPRVRVEDSVNLQPSTHFEQAPIFLLSSPAVACSGRRVGD